METTNEAPDLTPPVDLPRFRYLGGGAGTGKSYTTMREVEAEVGSALVATTGIAAVNLGGTTINSLVGYFDTNDLKNMFLKGWLRAKLRRLRDAGVLTLKLDEASMLAAEQLTYLTRGMDEVNRVDDWKQYAEMEPYERANMMGIHLIGDFCQLPPVKAGFAFTSPEWPRYEANTTILTKIWRQEDKDFVEALGHCRRGDGKKALEYFEPLMQKTIDSEFHGTTIYALNETVDRNNRIALDVLKGEQITYYSSRWGRPAGGWNDIPEKLPLKVGARVMTLANKKETEEDEETGRVRPTGRYYYVNGDVGEVVSAEEDGGPAASGIEPAKYLPKPVRVRIDRTGAVVFVDPVIRQNLKPLADGRVTEMKEQGLSHLIKYEIDPETKRGTARWEIVGEVHYMPLRLAYASTVHKIQGLTLPEVQVSLSDAFFSNPGSVYVALSRAKTAQGLRLVGSPQQFLMRCQADPRVRRFL